MDTLSYKTISVNKETAKKEWVVVDASEQVVGRLCSKVAKLLRGKYKPTFTPHVDCGDKMIRHAVKGMLPKGILGRHLLNNLYVIKGTELNGLEAQKPKAIDINQYK